MAFRESGALHLEILTQTPARNVPLEIDIFDGANPGTLLESLEGATSISYEELLNEVAAGKYLISVHDPKARADVVDREHLAKVKVGGIYRYSFWQEKRKIVSIGEDEEAEEHWQIGGREGTLAYLERAAWYGSSMAGFGDYITDGRWRFEAVTPGFILEVALEEALARSPSPIEFLTYDFDGSTDSQGALWPTSVTIDIEFGTSLLDTVRKLTAMGELDVAGRHDLRLQAYVELGRHLDATSIPNGVVFRAGQNIRTTLERTTSRPQVKTRMLVKGKGDAVFEVIRPDLEADPLIRRREGFLSFPDSADPTTIQRAAEADIEGRLADQESITVGVTHGDEPGQYEPYGDYRRGDWITVNDPGVYDMASHRIVGMALSSHEATFDVDLTLNSIEYEALLKLARKTGAYGSGPSGGTSSAVSGGSTGGTGGGSGRVSVETGDTPGLLYGKLEALGGTVLSIEGVSGSRKVGIRSAEAGVEDGYAPLSSGLLVPVGYLGSGTPDGTKFLRGDGVWAVPPGGGGGGVAVVVLGLPTGTLDREYTFDSTTESWSSSGGTLTSTGGRLQLVTTGATVVLEPSGAGDIADGEVQADFYFTNSDSDVSLIFRATDASNFYMVRLDNYVGGVTLYKCVGGGFTSLGTGPNPIPSQAGTAFRVMARFSGSVISLYINGSHVASWADTTYTTGRTGFRVGSSGKTVQSDNWRVYDDVDLNTGNVSGA